MIRQVTLDVTPEWYAGGMKIRIGRHQDRNLYVQLGDEPGDEDEYLGVIFDPRRAAILVEILNGNRPPFDREG